MIELIYSLGTNYEDTLAWLNDAEILYSASLSEKRKKQFCTGRALLRHHLVTVHQVSLEEVHISLPTAQAPSLEVSGKIYYISISHSADAVAVAISLEHKVGVDLERLKPRSNLPELQQTFTVFSNEGPMTLHDFYLRWTQCEAYCKYSGITLLKVLTTGLPAKQLRFESIQFGDNYLLTLCYNDRQNPKLKTFQSLLTLEPA